MIIIGCHNLMDHSQIVLSVTQNVTCGALTFQYALYILRKQRQHFSNNFNSFLFRLKEQSCVGYFIVSLKKGNCVVSKVRDGEESIDLWSPKSRQNSE